MRDDDFIKSLLEYLKSTYNLSFEERHSDNFEHIIFTCDKIEINNNEKRTELITYLKNTISKKFNAIYEIIATLNTSDINICDNVAIIMKKL